MKQMYSRLLGHVLFLPTKAVARGRDMLANLICHAQATVGERTRFYTGAVVENMSGQKNGIVVGAGCAIRGRLVTFPHGGQITIGRSTFVGQGSNIWSASKVVIGDRVMISHDVEIHDTNSHSLNAELRALHFSEIMSGGHPTELPDVAASPIVIGDDVWVGFRSIILKGVNIGAGSIVAAGSLVVDDVPPGVLVAGVPAKQIRKITENESSLEDPA